MLNVVVCVGSSCYVRGSEQVAAALDQIRRERGLADRVEIVGAFCMDHCSMMVSVRVGDRPCQALAPEETLAFFDREIMPALTGEQMEGGDAATG